MNEAYIMKGADLLIIMNLIVEGALNFFEGDAQPLYQLAMRNDMEQAALAFDIIGAALAELRKQIRTWQEEHRRECLRKDEA